MTDFDANSGWRPLPGDHYVKLSARPDDESRQRAEYTIYVCDVCGQDVDHADYPICPNCQSAHSLRSVKVVPADQPSGAVLLSREQALWLVGQIQGDTSASATEVRAQLLSLLTAGGKS
jgi:hypothetical protein